MSIKNRWRNEEFTYYDFTEKNRPNDYYFTFASIVMPCLRDNSKNMHGIILIWGHHQDSGNLHFFEGKEFSRSDEFCTIAENLIEKYDFGTFYYNEEKNSWKLYRALFYKYNLLKHCIFMRSDYGTDKDGEFLLMSKLGQKALKFDQLSIIDKSIQSFISSRSESFNQVMSAICIALFGIIKFQKAGINQPWQKQITNRSNEMSTEMNRRS